MQAKCHRKTSFGRLSFGSFVHTEQVFFYDAIRRTRSQQDFPSRQSYLAVDEIFNFLKIFSETGYLSEPQITRGRPVHLHKEFNIDQIDPRKFSTVRFASTFQCPTVSSSTAQYIQYRRPSYAVRCHLERNTRTVKLLNAETVGLNCDFTARNPVDY